MVLYNTDDKYFTIVSEVSLRDRLSTHSIYTLTHVEWLPLLIVVVCIKRNGESNFYVGLWNLLVGLSNL